ncbi:MAG: hypothetical protein GY838_13120 [bacterium]|nr:hypothetical protein [bacterium]
MTNSKKRMELLKKMEADLRALDPEWTGRVLALELEPDQLRAMLTPDEDLSIKELLPAQIKRLNMLFGPRYSILDREHPYRAFCPWCDWESQPIKTWAGCRDAAASHLTTCGDAFAAMGPRHVWVGPFHNATRVWRSRADYVEDMVTADEMKSDPMVWEPRAIPVAQASPMPDKVRAGEHDSDQPCPNPACLDIHRSLELVGGRIRMVCACGVSGAWAQDDEGANNNWDQLPRGVTDGD